MHQIGSTLQPGTPATDSLISKVEAFFSKSEAPSTTMTPQNFERTPFWFIAGDRCFTVQAQGSTPASSNLMHEASGSMHAPSHCKDGVHSATPAQPCRKGAAPRWHRAALKRAVTAAKRIARPVGTTTALFCSAAAHAHEGHGMPGVSHWHATDILGFLIAGGLAAIAIWLKGRK